MVGKKKGFFPVFVHLNMILMCVIVLLPFAIMIMSSMSSERSIIKYGYELIPLEFGFEAYDYMINR